MCISIRKQIPKMCIEILTFQVLREPQHAKSYSLFIYIYIY